MDMAGSIEMWLNFDAADDAWRLINSRLLYKQHAQRMLFDEPKPLEVALAPQVAGCLQTYLSSVRETAVFSDRDLVIDLGELRVRGLRVLTRFDHEGNATANIRLMSTDGEMSAVFAPDFRPGFRPPAPQPLPATVEDVTMPVLQDLLYPALEIFDHILENGLSEENVKVLAARVKTMRAKRDELSDYATLLSRFIEASDARRSSSLSGADRATARPLKLSTKHPLSVRNKSWDPQNGFQSGENALILHACEKPSTWKH